MTEKKKRLTAAERKAEQDEANELIKKFQIEEASKLKAALENNSSRYYLVKQIYYSGLFNGSIETDPGKLALLQGQRLLAIRTLREAHEIDRKQVGRLISEAFDYEKRLKKKGLA